MYIPENKMNMCPLMQLIKCKHAYMKNNKSEHG